MSSNEHIKSFAFSSKSNSGNCAEDKVEIIIPELLQTGYSTYTWPGAPILAWFLWQRRHSLVDKHILELGAGLALPGILAAKCGAKVTLTDSCVLPKTLEHIHHCCKINNLVPGEDILISGLSWGLLLNNIFNLPHLDYIIASDCFYDPSVFEDILVTVSFLLEHNPGAKFLFTYQERSSDWTIETLLKKWNLICKNVNLDSLETESGINLSNLPWTICSQDLKLYFSKFGPVVSSMVVFDKNIGMSKGYGFVVFGNRDGFSKAMNKQHHKLDGRILTVESANN